MRPTLIAASFAAAVSLMSAFAPSASAQQEQALNLTLLKTSIRTQSDDLTITNNPVQAFPNTTVTCPKTATKGCTLAIEVASMLYWDSSANEDTATLTVTGASLPRVDPAASIAMDGIYYGNYQWAAFDFRWMQRAVPAGAQVTVNIQFVSGGTADSGEASSRTETVELFKN
jgi:hypothetical protein